MLHFSIESSGLCLQVAAGRNHAPSLTLPARELNMEYGMFYQLSRMRQGFVKSSSAGPLRASEKATTWLMIMVRWHSFFSFFSFCFFLITFLLLLHTSPLASSRVLSKKPRVSPLLKQSLVNGTAQKRASHGVSPEEREPGAGDQTGPEPRALPHRNLSNHRNDYVNDGDGKRVFAFCTWCYKSGARSDF